MEVLSRLATEQPVPPNAVNRAVDRGLTTICMHCLEKDPRNRYASAGELADDLDRWLEGRPVSVQSKSAAIKRWGRLITGLFRRRRPD